MNQYGKYEDLFLEIYDREQVQLDAQMKEHIYFKVGGSVDILLLPDSLDKVVKSIKICKENKIPFYIIGNGSNILVKDGGIRGIVIKLCNINNISVDGDRITADTGALLKDVSKVAAQNSLTGFEFACGIPGSIGGAVFMNAGAYDGEISFVIEKVKVINNKEEIITLEREELDLGYRHSVMMDKGFTILNATFKLAKGDKTKINKKINELTVRREQRQPLEYASAGSTFKRPKGYFAGKLIQDAGLKGFTIGDSCVSNKHAGFVINKGNGTAKDILGVIAHVQEEVKKQFGVELMPEVRIIGED